MLKNILNLEGAQQLSKKEQNAIHGGAGTCWDGFCFPSQPKCNYYCSGTCIPCGLPSNGYTPHVCSENCG